MAEVAIVIIGLHHCKASNPIPCWLVMLRVVFLVLLTTAVSIDVVASTDTGTAVWWASPGAMWSVYCTASQENLLSAQQQQQHLCPCNTITL